MVAPSVLKADQQVKDAIDVDRRECRFPEENKSLKVFKSYSRQACLLECRTEKATNLCGCTPWNYPYVSTNKTCTNVATTECFEVVFNNIEDNECDCLMECNLVKYSFWVDAQRMERDCETDLS